MKKTLYYVVDKELTSNGETEETTGNKTVVVYDIIDNKPTVLANIVTTTDVRSTEAIQDYLNDNGFDDDDFELVQL